MGALIMQTQFSFFIDVYLFHSSDKSDTFEVAVKSYLTDRVTIFEFDRKSNTYPEVLDLARDAYVQDLTGHLLHQTDY